MELIVADQLTLREAAAALGIRQVTARVRLHRARTALRVATAPPAPPEVPETVNRTVSLRSES